MNNQSPYDTHTISTRISDIISTLRFPLLLMVVLIHCSLKYKIGAHAGQYSSATNIMYFFSDSLCSIAVPTYFLMSGYLFFGILGQNRIFTINNYVDKIRKRVYRLLIPYLLWNLIGFCMMVVFMKTPLKSFFPGLNIEINLSYFFNCFWSVSKNHSFFQTAGVPVDNPMWFVRDLIILCVLSPAIYIILRVFKIYCLIPLTALFIMGIWPHIVGFSLSGVLFFMIGAYCSIRGFKIISKLSTCWWLPTVAVTLMIIETLILPHGEIYIHSLSILFGVFGCIYIALIISKKKNIVDKLKNLGNLGFFIFASHMLISSETKTFICRIIDPHSNFTWLMCYLIIFLILCLIPTIIYLLLQKTAPTILNLLVGAYKPKKIANNK